MILLFSYGTLTDKKIQIDEFNMTFLVEDELEEISGFDMSQIEIDGIYYNILLTSNNQKTISGKIVYIPEEVINQVDNYEGESYKRITTKTKSGRNCQVYVKQN